MTYEGWGRTVEGCALDQLSMSQSVSQLSNQDSLDVFCPINQSTLARGTTLLRGPMTRYHAAPEGGMVFPAFKMALYILVGWIVISIAKLFIGDPLTVYLEISNSDLVWTVSAFISLVFHGAVGFAVLKVLKGLIVVEDRKDVPTKMALVRKYNEDWDDDMARCSEIMRSGSKSFYLASWLLPDWMRGPALALYAFCRKADDDIDEGDEDGAQARLDRLCQRLEDAYAGRPAPNCVDRSFSAVVRAFEIPKELPEALLDGFRWDLDKKKYETYTDVVAYSARVAAAVGGMMTVLMGGKTSVTFARAFDLGVAMQLTNICRDVGEDARNGRVYLPADWLREEGVDAAEFVKDPKLSSGVQLVVKRMLARADTLYERADSGISMLPRSCRVAIRAARLIYSDIGNKLESRNFDCITRRAVVSKKRKLLLVLQACLEMIIPGRPENREPVLPECQFLLDACLPCCQSYDNQVV